MKCCGQHVCLCVCLSVCEDFSETTRAIIFTSFAVHVVYGRGSVLLRQGDKMPRGRDSFGVFLPIDNALKVKVKKVKVRFLYSATYTANQNSALHNLGSGS